MTGVRHHTTTYEGMIVEENAGTEAPGGKKQSRGRGLAAGMGVGVAIGAGLGVATGNMGLWLGIGVAIGVAMGTIIDARNARSSQK